MAYYITYQIKGIDGQFIIPINQNDDVKFVATRIKKEFGIIQNLSARIYGSDLQGSKKLSECVRCQDVVTFVPKKSNEEEQKLELYRLPIITKRYKSKTTFIVFTTISFKSMTIGDKIKVNIEKDTNEIIKKKIKDMFKKNHHKTVKEKMIKAMKILVFLPGGIPFLKGTINDFVESFPDYMPHLYAIIIYNPKITEEVLDTKFETVCNIKNEQLKSLISPDVDRSINVMCEMASVLGYIQQEGPNVKRMIYSIAKFCPFAPMICGLYNLSQMSQVTGMTIIQITVPLIKLFEQMSVNLAEDDVFANTVRLMTYFMNIKISDRVPCTEFIRPFYNIGFEKYFKDNFSDNKFSNLENIISFDPDFRDIDWIRFELPEIQETDLDNAMKLTQSLEVIPVMSLRRMHRISLFKGKNGPWLFITASISKRKNDDDKIDYINPEVGEIESGKYEEIAEKTIGVDYKEEAKTFDKKVLSTIDPEKVTQLIFICVDKSGSMTEPYSSEYNRYQAGLKFFTKFTQQSYKYHTTSLYGSIMFNNQVYIKNKLNPLSNNFAERMNAEDEEPKGGTACFKAIEQAANAMLEENKDNKYPNAVLRVIVISDGEDNNAKKYDMAKISNFLIKNKIRVDSVIISDTEIAKELVVLTHFTGGSAIFTKTYQDGIELFNKEEFFNVDLRQFNDFYPNEVQKEDFMNLDSITVETLDKEIKAKPSEFANEDRLVTSPIYAISEFNKKIRDQLNNSDFNIEFSHPNQKRIINELKKIVNQNNDEVKVYPLKDRVDVWRVLIKGFEGSLYQNKWFYLIIEFHPEYPEHYPLFRFVYPPFHPNITDQGRVCIDTLDKRYRSDKSILELIGEVRYLLFEPNFESCIDLKREELKNNQEEFKRIVVDWNNKNGRDTPKEWEEKWKIQEDGNLVLDNISAVTIPEQFLCPISRKIMKEPVLATSGVFYEKRELEKYLQSNKNPYCRGKIDESGNPIPLKPEENMNLPVNNLMKTNIAKWKAENGFREDEENENENNAIMEFRKSGNVIEKPLYIKNFTESKNNVNTDENSFSHSRKSRPRPELSEK